MRVVPPPSSTILPPPSITVSTSVRTVSWVVIGITVRSLPHANVMTPPCASAVVRPACVQSLTTVVGVLVSGAALGRGARGDGRQDRPVTGRRGVVACVSAVGEETGASAVGEARCTRAAAGGVVVVPIRAVASARMRGTRTGTQKRALEAASDEATRRAHRAASVIAQAYIGSEPPLVTEPPRRNA